MRDGRLADLAPTLLALMGLPVPAEMTGTSLV
jgi:2,3-bisphosphoglycerate-independent phosphoglycerate mutase